MNIQKPQDIHQSNKQQRTDYIAYVENENYNGIINTMYNSDGTQKDELIGKCVVKEFYNSFIDGFIQVGNYNQKGILDVLANHLSDYNLSINNIKVLGYYDENIQYNINNVLYYNGDSYFVINTPPVGTLPTDTNYFIKLGLRGDKGITSLGLLDCGVWDDTVTYEQYNMVQYNNILYISKTSNTNKKPSENSNDWSAAIDFNISTPELSSVEPSCETNGSLWLEVI